MGQYTATRQQVGKLGTKPGSPADRVGRVNARVVSPLYRLHRSLGNQTYGRWLQAKLEVNQPGDRFEQEANRIAEVVTGMPEPVIQRRRHCGGTCEACRKKETLQRKPVAETVTPLLQRQVKPGSEEEPEEESLIQRKAQAEGPTEASGGLASHIRGLHGGRPLQQKDRSFFETRFGTDFSDVRVHTGPEAGALAQAVNARAFTVGRDVIFGARQYAPDTTEGQNLMAHELTHVVQQRGASKSVQRQPAQQSGASSDITVRDIFPFPTGSRVLMSRIMADFIFNILSSREPGVAAALQAIDRQEANVTNATDDLFEAVIAGPISIPAQGDQPARTLRDITLRLQRTGGAFDFSLSAREEGQTNPTPLMSQTGLSARRDRGGIVLSSGTGTNLQPQLLIAPGEEGEVRISAFTAAVAGEQIPLVPETIETISLSRLPDAASDAEVQRVAERIARRQASQRRIRRQEFTLAPFTGAQIAGGDVAPLLFTSWQIRFPTTRILAPFNLDPSVQQAVGEIVQIPVEVQLQYAPSTSLIGGVSTGLTARLPTEVPINFRLITGVAGGRVEVPVGEESEGRGVFGPTFGGGAGVELGRWRVNLRYEFLKSVLENSPNVHSAAANVGIAW